MHLDRAPFGMGGGSEDDTHVVHDHEVEEDNNVPEVVEAAHLDDVPAGQQDCLQMQPMNVQC